MQIVSRERQSVNSSLALPHRPPSTVYRHRPPSRGLLHRCVPRNDIGRDIASEAHVLLAMSEAWGKQSPRSHCHCERSEAISSLTLSLRAKRSNLLAARGLLRRCAPRNDNPRRNRLERLYDCRLRSVVGRPLSRGLLRRCAPRNDTLRRKRLESSNCRLWSIVEDGFAACGSS